MRRTIDLPRGLTAMLLSALALSRPVWGQEQVAKLLPPQMAPGGNFGVAVAFDGETALVGAYLDESSGVQSGSVSVFERQGLQWTRHQVLVPSDAAKEDFFGISVALSGDAAIVAAPFEDHGALHNAGAAYVFRRVDGRWIEEQKLIASDGANNDRLDCVDISGDIAIVGASSENHEGLVDAGAAYVFRRTPSGWVEQQKLIAPDGTGQAFFGRSVRVDGDMAVIGAPQAYGPSTGFGAAYVYRRSGASWNLEQTLWSPAGFASFGGFGSSLALSRDVIVVGAPFWSLISEASSVSIFRRSGGIWTQEAQLLSADAAPPDGFGYAVDMSGDTVVAGNANDDSSTGLLQVFRRAESSWELVQTVQAGDGSLDDNFGTAVAVSGDTALVGSFLDDDNGVNAGSAYVFELNWNDLGSGLAGASGTPRLVGAGSPTANKRIDVALSSMQPFAPTLLVIGANTVATPLKGGVLLPSLDRLVPLSAGPTGELELKAQWPAPWPSGLELIFQAWCIDPTGPEGYTATNAVSSASD